LTNKYLALKNIYLLRLFLLFPLFSYATHLVGGEMTYTCLGGNQYEIRIVIYRDCGPTNENQTGFDSSGTISIYNSDNSLVQSVTIFNPITTILSNETVGNDCLELPTDLCIEQGVYTVIVELEPITGGYQIAYQRCCRNPSIINIPTPEDYGSTFTAHIPGTEQTEDCNSSPAFNSYPPLALCLGDAINVDLSATDPDGDSLVYEFATPLHGANDTDPTQITPPPFSPIPWAATYSESYPMDSNPPLEINYNSGFITGTPTMMGMFIIGIKVSEYRDGILINEIIRDFRFLVVDCNVTTASFPLSTWYCNSLTVEFENNSFNADSYLWDFGISNASSTLYEPNYTYPDTGMYTVTLIANPYTVCADTNTVSFPLYTELNPFFISPEPQCIDINNFTFQGQGLLPEGTQFNWEFGANASPSSSNMQIPNGISFNNVGTYDIIYHVVYENCDETFVASVEVFDEDIFPEIPNLEAQCLEGNSFNFTAQGQFPPNSSFEWDFGTNASPAISNQQNPNNVQFSNSGIQNITLTVSSNGCDNSTENTLEVYEIIELNIESSPPDGCEPYTVEFDSNLDPNLHLFSWDLGNGSSDSTSTTQTTYSEGQYDISLDVINIVNNCQGSISLENYVTVLPQPISDFEVQSESFLYGDPVWVINHALYADSYLYAFSSGYTTTEEEPEYIIPGIGEYTILQYAMNDLECVDSSSVNIFLDSHPSLWTPNAFTPNKDNNNDYFFPIFKDVKQYRLQIFNRWGEIIFDETGESPKWDGNFTDGRANKEDTYVFLIDYETIYGEWRGKRGVITLIR